jgi:hypothetical protein
MEVEDEGHPLKWGVDLELWSVVPWYRGKLPSSNARGRVVALCGLAVQPGRWVRGPNSICPAPTPSEAVHEAPPAARAPPPHAATQPAPFGLRLPLPLLAFVWARAPPACCRRPARPRPKPLTAPRRRTSAAPPAAPHPVPVTTGLRPPPRRAAGASARVLSTAPAQPHWCVLLSLNLSHSIPCFHLNLTSVQTGSD